MHAPGATDVESERLTRLAPCIALLAIGGLGAFFRLHQVADQVVLGDEAHAVWTALTLSYGQIFGRFLESDACIPLTLITKAVADTVGLDEISLRWLPLAAGLATPVVLPLMVVRRVGWPSALTFAGLLAISPMLVFFSRNARPYAICVLLVGIALLSVVRFIETRRWPSAALYLVCGTLAGWLHLLTLPTLLTPLAAGCLIRWTGRGAAADGARVRDLVLLGAALLGGLALLLAAPLMGSSEQLISKTFSQEIGPWKVIFALQTLLGTPHPWSTLLMVVGVGLGLFVGLRRHPTLTLVLAAAFVAQLVTVLAAQPYRAWLVWVLARYQVFGVPSLLLFCALAPSALVGLPGRWGRALPPLLSAVAIGALLLGGPLLDLYLGPNALPNLSRTRFAYSGEPARAALEVPRWYVDLAEEEGEFAIVETPWSWNGGFPYHEYQRVHGRSVLVGQVGNLVPRPPRAELPLSDPRLRLARTVDATDVDALVARSVRYVVHHKQLPSLGLFPSPRLDVSRVIDHYRERVGPPVFESENIAVFRLDRVRSRPNVVLVTVDTLRADHIGPYGGPVPTPGFDRIAREGIVVERAYTSTPTTGPAHASLFTGLYPWNHRVLDNGVPLGSSMPTLAEALSQTGYETAAVVSSYVLHDRFGFARGFDHYAFEATERSYWMGRWREGFFARGGATTRSALAWLDARTPSRDRPFILWIHYFDPHTPYRPPPGYRLGPEHPVDLAHKQVPKDLRDRRALADAIRAYRGEVGYVDAQLGELTEGLRVRGLLASTVLVVTSDHGEGLGDHAVLQHGTNLHEEQVRVPLLIRSPYLAANVRLAGPVQLEDLFPTILSFAGVTPPERIDGVDLRAWLEGRAPEPPREYVLGRRKRYPRRPDVYFALGADAKWIGERAKPGSSYALDTDSRELSAATGQGMPIPLERQIEHAERTRGRGAPSRVVDPEVQRALEQLGYVDEAREPDP